MSIYKIVRCACATMQIQLYKHPFMYHIVSYAKVYSVTYCWPPVNVSYIGRYVWSYRKLLTCKVLNQ